MINYKNLFFLAAQMLVFCFFCDISVAVDEYIHVCAAEDLVSSKRRSLISGKEDLILNRGMSVITLGFTSKPQMSSYRLEHAYLVFEKRNEGEIDIEGIHLRGVDYFADYYGAGEYQYSTALVPDDSSEVLKKFVRAEKRRKKDNSLVEIRQPMYTKYRSFVVDAARASVVLNRARRHDPESVSFSLVGNLLSESSHNCCTYVAKILRDCGLNISFKWYIFRTPENLKKIIKNTYLQETDDVFTPLRMYT